MRWRFSGSSPRTSRPAEMIQAVGKFFLAAVLMPSRVQEIHQRTAEIDKGQRALEIKVEHWKTVVEQCPNCQALRSIAE